MCRPLSIKDLVLLSTIGDAAGSCAKVKWLTGNGDIVEGVARSIGDANGNFLKAGEDVRDAFLRISAGMEWFLPVSDVVGMLERGEFAVSR